MRINLIAVGKKMPDWISEGIEHYKKQLPKNYNFSITLIESQSRKSKNPEQTKNLEESLILNAASDSNLLIAFDELGKQQTSKELSKSIEKWQLNADSVALIIGGADGLDNSICKRAQYVISFGKQTWPHMLVRGLLAEQLYRAQCILYGHPYHRV